MKIRILKNPVGRFNLSYEVGEVIDLPDSKALDLIMDKYGERVDDVEEAISKAQPEKAIKRGKK